MHHGKRPPRPNNPGKDWPELLLLGLLPLGFLAPFFKAPLDADEGAYATVAGTILRRGVPYRHAFDHKPPLVYFWYALSFLVSGKRPAAPRAMAAACAAVSVLLVSQCGRELSGERRVGRLAGFLFGSAFSNSYLRADANTEMFMLPPMIAAFLSFLRGQRSGGPGWYVIAGFLSGLAVLTKTVAIFNTASLALILAVQAASRQIAVRVAAVRGLLLAAGGALAAIPVVCYFLAKGAWRQFWQANVTYNRIYTQSGSWRARWQGLCQLHTRVIAGGLFHWLLALAGAAVVARRRWPGRIPLLAWAAASLVGVKSTGREYHHYYLQLLPAAALLGAFAVSAAVARWGSAGARLAICALAAPAIALSLVKNLPTYLAADRKKRQERRTDWPYQADVECKAEEIARHVRSMTRRGERIYNFGGQPQLYFLADREPANRFIYDSPFWLDSSTLEEALEELLQSPPDVIIDTFHPEVFDYESGQERPAQLARLLEERYSLEARVHFANIYRRKDRQEA